MTRMLVLISFTTATGTSRRTATSTTTTPTKTSSCPGAGAGTRGGKRVVGTIGARAIAVAFVAKRHPIWIRIVVIIAVFIAAIAIVDVVIVYSGC